MNRILTILAITASSMLFSSNSFALPLLTWSISGPGTIGAVQNAPNDWDLNYNYNRPNFDAVTWTVTASTITTAGNYEFDWNYSGFHSWFQTNAFLITTETTNTTLVNGAVGGGFNVSGNYTFTGLNPGDVIGFTMGGDNFDSNNVLLGTLNLQQVVPEPASLALLGLGLAGLGFSRRKKQVAA